MKTTRLGRTGLEVSPIAFGTWQLGGDWGSFDESGAIDAIRTARDLGINFFDTAQSYGFGACERLLGRALRQELDTARDQVVIATKGGLRPAGDGEVARDSSPERLRRGVESSLEALGTDYIDLYQVHWPDPNTPFAETAGALGDLLAEGKIRHIGVSNFDAHQMEEFSRTRQVETLQPPYSLFRRDIETSILPYASEHDIGVLVYGPLSHGLLSGTMTEDTTFADSDWRSRSPMFQGEEFRRNLERVRGLERLAAKHDASVSQLAIAWTLSNPAVQVAIVGARKAEHIEEAIQATNLELDALDFEVIADIISGAVAVTVPVPETV